MAGLDARDRRWPPLVFVINVACFTAARVRYLSLL